MLFILMKTFSLVVILVGKNTEIAESVMVQY